MVDTKRLTDIIRVSGLKKVYIAEKLGVSYQGYLNKESGKSDFTASQIATLKDLLSLSNKDIMDIFLS